MAQQNLQAPWRMEYLRSLEAHDASHGGCFICQAHHAPREAWATRLILWATPRVIVQLNRYPYVSGHLLVSPRRHESELDELTDDEAADLMTQTRLAVRVLKRAFGPQGFNVGINLGRAGGAGVPGHLHQHVVPRWSGDTNFLAVVGEVKLVTQALEKTRDELLAAATALGVHGLP